MIFNVYVMYIYVYNLSQRRHWFRWVYAIFFSNFSSFLKIRILVSIKLKKSQVCQFQIYKCLAKRFDQAVVKYKKTPCSMSNTG